MSKEQESNLLTFLQKVSRACDNDNSVPEFVGSQVNEWLKELQEKGTPEVVSEVVQPEGQTEKQEGEKKMTLADGCLFE
ncbi:hypothetical protein FGO68_gene12208 [Halteria grandinella]|uniref:Uncharacterized protein n=1 Tax=Halteria grandinella TaxID=5974 RepID=A0A8J8NDQ5_HALGN|nr:hypothetical protein FGO68_gene12208 [Halteria grandinella]